MSADEAASTSGDGGAGQADPSAFDTSRAHQARVYDYLLGGQDNISQEVRADFRNRV